jgi:hypothetical protein
MTAEQLAELLAASRSCEALPEALTVTLWDIPGACSTGAQRSRTGHHRQPNTSPDQGKSCGPGALNRPSLISHGSGHDP